MRRFCYVCSCVCVDFVMCVYVWILLRVGVCVDFIRCVCVDFVMCFVV